MINMFKQLFLLVFIFSASFNTFALPNPAINHYVEQNLKNRDNEILLDFSYFFPGTSKQEILDRYPDLKDYSTTIYQGKSIELSSRTISYPAKGVMGYKDNERMPEVTQRFIFCDGILVLQKNETKFDSFSDILFDWTSGDCNGNLIVKQVNDEYIIFKSHNHSNVSSLLLNLPQENSDTNIVEVVFDPFFFFKLDLSYLKCLKLINSGNEDFDRIMGSVFFDGLSNSGEDYIYICNEMLLEWTLNLQLYSIQLPSFKLGEDFQLVKNHVESANGVVLEQDGENPNIWKWKGGPYEEYYCFEDGRLSIELYCFKDVSFSPTLLDMISKFGGKKNKDNPFVIYPDTMPDRMIEISHNDPDGWSTIAFLPRK